MPTKTTTTRDNKSNNPMPMEALIRVRYNLPTDYSQFINRVTSAPDESTREQIMRDEIHTIQDMHWMVRHELNQRPRRMSNAKAEDLEKIAEWLQHFIESPINPDLDVRK